MDVTIKDIAKELNLSISTVSRSLQDHYSISEKTKKRVKDLAKKLGYQPNPAAISLLKKKTSTIGVVLPQVTSSFFSQIVSGIEKICLEENYQVLFCLTHESYVKEKNAIEILLSSRVDGIILALSQETILNDHLIKVIQKGTALVLLDRILTEINCNKVGVNDMEGAFEAVNFLINKGCKSILHLCGPRSISTGAHRLEGYIEALKFNNIPIDDMLIYQGELNEVKIEDHLQLLKLNHKIPNAIFAFNDFAAYEAIKVFKKHGSKIPEDISIIGFGNESLGKYLTPQLSTVMQPAFELGETSAKLLLEEIRKKNVSGAHTKILPTNLVLRGTT